MNIKKSIYLWAAAALMTAACSPDDYSLSKPNLTADDLVEGVAYKVSVDAQNTVTLTSLLDKSYQCYWEQPNGRSQGHEVTLQLPFQGEYEVTFGVDTRGGVVYGAPHKFQVTTNNMSLLEDPLYANLTGGVGGSKKWVPCDKSYGVGQCTGPVMYCNPDDVLNDGSSATDIGINRMKPNWDPGFQSWLIPGDSPYMDSYMVFSLDDKNGCTIEEYQGEEGTTTKGKWNLNLSDKNHPVLSFTDAYAMHNTGFNSVCDNYTTNIVITELTPYMLQLATMRTNSEGAWWIIWNFIAEDVKTGKVVIPTDDPEYIETSEPVLPEVADLPTKLFTTDINGVNFTGDQMTFLPSDEAPYDWMWWNGASSTWVSVVNGNYGSSWAPRWTEDDIDMQLVLTRKADGTYTYQAGTESGTLTIEDSQIVFDKELTLFTVTGEQRTVALTGQTWQVFKCDPGSELVIGVADKTDSNGKENTFLVATFTYKAVGGGQAGPVSVPFNNDNRNCYIEAGNYFRCQLYNPWGGDVHAIDPADVKLKKNQKINVTFRISGFSFTQAAKMVLCCNRGDEQNWEPDCFSYARAIDVAADGTYTVSWTNDTGSTVQWNDGQSALTMTMQYTGFASLPDEDLNSHCSIESITIE